MFHINYKTTIKIRTTTWRCDLSVDKASNPFAVVFLNIFLLSVLLLHASTPFQSSSQLQKEFRQSHDLDLFIKPWPIVKTDELNIAKISALSSSHFWQNKSIYSFVLQGIAKWDNLSLIIEPMVVNELYGPDLLGVYYAHAGVSGRFTNAFIRYENNLVNLQLGRSPVWWGQSFYHSILPTGALAQEEVQEGIQSGFSPAYDHLDMRFKFGQFQLEMLSGQLGSEWLNKERILRNIAGHRLTWLSKESQLIVSFGEQIIYTGKNRGIEWQYMNPATLYVFSVLEDETELNGEGDNDNSILFATIRYVPIPTLSVFCEFIIDDYMMNNINSQNALGIKIGLDGSIIISSKPTSWELEWTSINSWTYINGGQFTTWQNRGHSLGYPYGPDLNSFRIQADMQIKPSLFFNIESDWLEKGSNTLSTEWGNSDNLDDPFPNPPVTVHKLLSTSVSWFWKYGILETGWSNYDFANKIAFSDPTSKTKGGFFLNAQFFYDFGFKL